MSITVAFRGLMAFHPSICTSMVPLFYSLSWTEPRTSNYSPPLSIQFISSLLLSQTHMANPFTVLILLKVLSTQQNQPSLGGCFLKVQQQKQLFPLYPCQFFLTETLSLYCFCPLIMLSIWPLHANDKQPESKNSAFLQLLNVQSLTYASQMHH